MIEKIVVIPDAHVSTSTSKEYKVVKKFIKEFKPNKIILLGDFMDVSALSHWDMDKKRLIEGKRYKKEIEAVNRELDYLQEYSDEIVYIEGNHEDRVERYLDTNPEVEGLLEVQDLLKLKERNIKWISINKTYRVGHMYFTHGMYANANTAKRTLMAFGCNICVGHTHRPQVETLNMVMQRPTMSYVLGCLCDKSPDYLNDKPSSWINQFAVMYNDTRTGKFNLYPINIIDSQFIWEGKSYAYRNKD